MMQPGMMMGIPMQPQQVQRALIHTNMALAPNGGRYAEQAFSGSPSAYAGADSADVARGYMLSLTAEANNLYRQLQSNAPSVLWRNQKYTRDTLTQMNIKADQLKGALTLGANHMLRDAAGQNLLRDTSVAVKRMVKQMREEEGGCYCLGSCKGCCDGCWLRFFCCNCCWDIFGACFGGSPFLGNQKIQDLAKELEAIFAQVVFTESIKVDQHGEVVLQGENGGTIQTQANNVTVLSQFGENQGVMVSMNGVALHTELVTGAPGFLQQEPPDYNNNAKHNL